MSAPRLVSGLREISPGHDALICDVWGVIHDGHRSHPAAAGALREFRRLHGPVILLTNAPRVPAEVAAQCAAFGLPPDCYDAIVSSGGAARSDLEARVRERGGVLPLYYIGPDRDLPMIEGLGVTRTAIADAAVALCIGLADDTTETPADYAAVLAAMRARKLVMLCANPDIQVHRGAHLVWCAGALARDYQALGGDVVYYGKPHRPIYDLALATAAKLLGHAPLRPLAVGDGLLTDIKGANGAGLEVLFVADGVHGKDVLPYNAAHLETLFARWGARADAAVRSLRW